jgi:hypothetical protein
MNLQIINELSVKVNQIEELLLDIDYNLPKVAPDMYSALITKKFILNLLNNLQIIREDLYKYKNGESFKDEQKKILKQQEKLQDFINKNIFKIDKNDDDNGGFPPFDTKL